MAWIRCVRCGRDVERQQAWSDHDGLVCGPCMGALDLPPSRAHRVIKVLTYLFGAAALAIVVAGVLFFVVLAQVVGAIFSPHNLEAFVMVVGDIIGAIGHIK